MKKFSRMMIFALLLCTLAADALAESGFLSVPDVVRPGKAEYIHFYLDGADEVTLMVMDVENNKVAVLFEEEKFLQGENVRLWNGKNGKGENLQAGTYTLCLTGHQVQDEISLVIGGEAPELVLTEMPDIFIKGEEWSLFGFRVNMQGSMVFVVTDENGTECIRQEEGKAGPGEFWWNADVYFDDKAPGRYRLQWILKDETDGMTDSVIVEIEMKEKPEEAAEEKGKIQKEKVQPAAYDVPNEPLNYWTLPYHETDENRIWQAMMEPMTVINGLWDTYPIRKTPDASTAENNIAGEVAEGTQGVHVLLHLDNGWSMVEVYNAAAGYDKTDELIIGYVETKSLKPVIPDDAYGLLVDKLEQRMYVFRQGECVGSLRIATGRHNTETISGEYVTMDAFFQAEDECLNVENMLTITNKLVIHTVPYEIWHTANGAEQKWRDHLLSGKVTDGCIWVDAEINEDGLNMQWLYENVPDNTKVMIWDDTARELYGVELYYNPQGGRYYHSNAFCSSVREVYRPLTAFPAEELENAKFSNLYPCVDCVENSQMYERTKWSQTK